ncbi:MAG: RNB domain-containing ribonuclease [Acidobacteria bacterium]|nr:RNB domain-containing ribonuclease [Acidobacteriota bacterium]
MGQQRQTLFEIARQAMIDRELLPDFSREAMEQVSRLESPPPLDDDAEDMRSLPWVSIDNDDTIDIDQVSYATTDHNDAIRLYVGIASVDWLVDIGTPVDRHAAHNTTTVYTPVHNFLMIPAELCTDLTSLSENADRMGLVIEMVIETDGTLSFEKVYPARLRNHSKLAYDSLSRWLDEEIPELDGVTGNSGIEESIRLQDEASRRLFAQRRRLGALELDTIESHAILEDDEVVDLVESKRNRARLLIENQMIAANGVTTRCLESKNFPTFRRIVRKPRRWDRIMSIAEERGGKLPPEPDSGALDRFLAAERERDPTGFPDLSLTIVKLIGRGEYGVELPGGPEAGHFGLAVQDYSHSTAPNRRFPDLITHRLVKSALAAEDPAYSVATLRELAEQCTDKEDAANKVERRVAKSAAAMLLSRRIGQVFSGIVTGAADKGTWVRIFSPPAEGKLVRGAGSFDVGDRLRVRLVRADVDRGFIDFEPVS